MKIRWKLTLLLLFLGTVIVLAAAYFSFSGVESYYHSRMLNEMQVQEAVFESIARQYPMHDTAAYDYLQNLARTANHRLTLITENGTVVFESDVPRDGLMALENHRQRPEVVEAFATGMGTAERWSATLKLSMRYLAKRIEPIYFFGDSTHPVVIVRIGLPMTVVNEPLSEMRATIVSASILLFLFVLAASLLLARWITNPVRTMNSIAAEIRGGNLDLRIPVTTHDEIGTLAETLNDMIDRLKADISTLKKLERVRSEFLGNVSHELRTPIFAIQGMLETLLGGAANDPSVSRDFLERALRNTERLNTLLGDLIEISRIESGDMKMSFRYFPPAEFLAGVVADFTEQATKKGIALSLNARQEVQDVLGDRERIKQAMINLIDNAIKYTPSGGRIDITLTGNAGGCTIRVSDTGIGIDAEHLPRIFERFYRVDKERSREAGGTGLGLAIVKHIIEAHGGAIRVTSTPGVGSSFEFSLKA